MATSKVAGGSEELSTTLVATRRASGNKSRMNSEHFGRLSLVDASKGSAPAPTNSRQRRRSQRLNPESQAVSGLRSEEVTTTMSEGRTGTTTTAQRYVRSQDNGRTSPQTSFSQPPDGGVYLSRPDREGIITLNPTAPAYQPLGFSPVGNFQVSQYGSGMMFTPYQPVRLVANFRRVSLWRIDKCYRYSSTSKAQTSVTPFKEAIPPPKGRWTGSPPRVSVVPRSLSFSVNPSALRPRSETSTRDQKIHLPAPAPTPKYITQASRPSIRLQRPQPLLLILDLNGTLLVRRRASSSYTPRPSLDRFLGYCFEHHSVLIWSSATPTNVTAICRKIFSKEQRQHLLGEWGRDTLGLTHAQYKGYVQVYKRLDRIWDSKTLSRMHPDSKKGIKWDQKNTVLIDDSALKASAQPHNLVQIPEFTKDKADTCDVLQQIVTYLEGLRMFEDVSNFIKEKPFRAD